MKALQAVVGERGAVRALIYLGSNSGPGTVRRDYLEAVIAAARHWDLPLAALVALRSFANGAGQDHGRAQIVSAPHVRPRFATPFDRS